SPETCKWSSHEEQSFNTSTNTPFVGTSPDGVEHLFASYGEAHREFGLNMSAVHRCLHGQLKSHHGWKFHRPEVGNGKVMRFDVIDQVAGILAEMEVNPGSRRMLMTTWNPAQIEQ